MMVPTFSVKYWISQAGLTTNILILFTGILKNPGIPQSYLDRILKEKKSGKEEIVEENLGDIENNTSALRRKPQEHEKQYVDPRKYCNICKLDKKDQFTEHCEDCDVCIDDLDHHCVFFGKCIGGGNLYAFYGTIVCLFVNCGLVATTIVCFSGSASVEAIFTHFMGQLSAYSLTVVWLLPPLCVFREVHRWRQSLRILWDNCLPIR